MITIQGIGVPKDKNGGIFNFNEESTWSSASSISSRSFICFNCNNKVASNSGYIKNNFSRQIDSIIYICPHCKAPNIWDDNFNRVTDVIYGENIQKLPEDVAFIYKEARKCISVGAYTATAMLLRKLLMNFAIEKGTPKIKEGAGFSEYVSFLCDEGYVHRSNRKKAEDIKKLGNTANHKVAPVSEEDAKKIFNFVSLLLKYNYELADEEALNNDK